MENVKIVIGADHGGFEYKKVLIDHLKANNIEVEDVGTYTKDSVDYPKIAKTVATMVATTPNTRGILICGSGVGMSIVANKVKNIRAALCCDTYCARVCREHNNSNVLCLGQRIIGEQIALEIVDVWLKTAFAGGRHQRRVEMIE